MALVALAAGCGESARQRDEPTPTRTVRIAAAGDYGMGPSASATFNRMKKARPDLVLGLGDFSYAGPGSAGRFCGFIRSRLGAGTPFEVLAGNHEEDSGEDGRIADYARCLPDRLGSSGAYGKQYYFDIGRLARVIVISPDLTIDGKHYFYGRQRSGRPSDDLRWLTRVVDNGRSQGVRWTIVAMHKNCISVGQYYCDIYQDLFSTLIEKKVDLVMSGHDHTYQRSKQVVAGRRGCRAVIVDHYNGDCIVHGGSDYRKGAGTAFVISGAGGRPLYKLNDRDPEAGYFAATMGANTPGKRNGFSLLELSPRRLRARFVGSTPGSFGDRFEISAP